MTPPASIGEPVRRVGFVAAVLLQLAVLALPGATAQFTYTVRTDPITENTLSGFLTWNAGAKAIAWDASAASEDAVDPHPASGTPDMRANNYQAAATIRPYSDPGNLLPPPDEFRSAPLPRLVYIDVNRPLMLDLYVKSPSACSTVQLDVELLLGTTLVAGGLHGLHGQIYNAYAPRPPAGWCLYAFRMRAETDTLPMGSVLTLRITHFKQDQPFQYGFASDHRSALHIHAWPAEEAVFRRSIPKADDGSGGGAASLIGVALLGAPIALLGRGRGPRAVLLAFVLAGLGGCVGGPGAGSDGGKGNDEGSSGKVEVIEDEDNETGLANGTTGSIVGQVFDELHYPIVDAHVSLLGTSQFGTTSSGGRFSFTGLRPATYGLRVDKKEFRSFDDEVEVRAGAITKIEIQMVSIHTGSTPDARPHTHDYWGDRTEIKLLDDFNAGSLKCSGDPNAHCRDSSTRFRLQPKEDRVDESLVLPGTLEMEVRINWDAAAANNAGIRRVGFRYFGNEDPGITVSNPTVERIYYTNDSSLFPRARNVPFRVPVTWEMADRGHQRASSWWFNLYIDGQETTAINRNQAGGLTGTPTFGPFLIDMVIRKGRMPLEASHPDFWHGNDTLVLIDNQPSKQIALMTDSCGDGCQSNQLGQGWRPERVPPETRWLEVIYEKSIDTDNPFGVYYRSAEMDPSTSTGAFKLIAGSPTKAKRVETRHVVAAFETDTYYSSHSGWVFTPREQTGSTDTVTTVTNLLTIVTGTSVKPVPTHKATIIAHRDEPPA